MTKKAAADITTFSKTGIYEALYDLNAGIQQFLNAVTVLENSGLSFGMLAANKLLAEELRAGMNHAIVSVMEQIESRDWAVI